MKKEEEEAKEEQDAADGKPKKKQSRWRKWLQQSNEYISQTSAYPS